MGMDKLLDGVTFQTNKSFHLLSQIEMINSLTAHLGAWEIKMDLFSLVIGIAVGAAFSPFWMMVWAKVKAAVSKADTTPPAA